MKELWLYEYTLTEKGEDHTYVSVCAHTTEQSAIEAGKRHAANTENLTLIGPVKFIREEVAA